MAIYNVSGSNVYTENPILDDALLHLLYTNSTSPKADLQGVTTDGRYIYVVEYNRSTIYKYEILTGTITSATYSNNVCGHGNGATYNPVTNKLYIATCNQDGGEGIAVFTTSLTYDSTIHVYNASGTEQKVAGIAYNRLDNKYYCCWENDYYVYDSNFELVRTFNVDHTHPYIYGALETDGEYLYRPLWDNTSSPHKNYIAVYDFSGNHKKTINVDSTLEIEDVAYDWNGNWYTGINVDGGIGWRLYYSPIRKYAEIAEVNQLIQIWSLT